MQDFNLDAALAAWRQRTLAARPLETEDLTELESGLLDRYDEFLIKGYAPAEAFAAAVGRVAAPVANETGRTGNGGWPLLANYLKVATRNLRARRWYNLTNFLVLTVGIITATLAVLYLAFETSYDAHLTDADRKYRVGMTLRAQGYSMIGFSDYGGTARAGQLRQVDGLRNVPGVVRATHFATFPEAQLTTLKGQKIPQEHVLHTNTPADLLTFFDVVPLAGDTATFRQQVNTALLTETAARKYYGDDFRRIDFTDQVLRIDTTNYTVTGVVADPAPTLHFTYSVLLHRPTIGYWGARTYVELAEGADAETVRARMTADFASVNTRLAEDELFGGVLLQPVTSLHLHGKLLYEPKPPGDVRYLYLIGLIAVILLLLTVSNYTNLSIVMNAGRTREIGMRKVFGASGAQVAVQFLLESVVLSLLTLPLVALGLWWIVPRFNLLMGVELSRSVFADAGLVGTLLLLTLGVGLLAGAYPAYHLARTQVQRLFKEQGGTRPGARFTSRKVIITLQFALLIGLCSLTLFVNRQLVYIQEKDLGFDRTDMLYVSLNADSSRFATFRNEVLRLPGVTGVGSGTPMGLNPYNQLTYKLSGTDQVYDDAHNIYMDYRGLAQMGIQTSIPDYVAEPDKAPDRLVLINQTLADRLKNRFGLTDAELIGQTIIQEPEYTDEETGQVGFPYLIGGTFADVHLFSLRETIDPMILNVYREPSYVYTAFVSYRGQSRPELLAAVEQRYEDLGLDRQFTASFLTDNLAELYQDEQRISTLSNYFSLLALLMAVIGLVALTAYLTTLRRKEIGVRKILGASNWDILRRFNLEYAPLLLIAAALAVPLTWWGVARWLEGFAYRIDLDPLVFLVATLAVAMVSVAAVSFVAWRAAVAVPARVLSRGG